MVKRSKKKQKKIQDILDDLKSYEPKKTLKDGSWGLAEKLGNGEELYEECYYDMAGKLVVLNGRRIYVGDRLKAEFSVNAQGEKDGKYTEYNAEGKPVFESYYKNDIMDGDCFIYTPNGELRTKGRYRNNSRVGVWVVYDEKGRPMMEVNYSKDPKDFCESEQQAAEPIRGQNHLPPHDTQRQIHPMIVGRYSRFWNDLHTR